MKKYIIGKRSFLLVLVISALLYSLFGCTSNIDRRIADLKGPSPELRYLSADALKGTDDRNALRALVAALNDEDLEVVKQAVFALGQMKDPLAIQPLIGLLDHADKMVRHRVKKALATYGARAVYPLTFTFKDQSDQKVREAVQVLGSIRDTRAVVPTVELLEHPSDGVRREAAKALGIMGGYPSIIPLIDCLSDPDPVVQHTAAKSLEKLKPLSVMPLIAALQNDDLDRVWRVVTVLGNIADSRAVDPLVGLLTHGSDTIRMEAVVALGKINNPDVLPKLVIALGDDLPAIASIAADSFVKRGTISVDPLIAALGNDDQETVIRAARALGRIGDIRAVDPLIGLLQFPVQRVRSAASIALGGIKDTRAIEHLISMLKNEEGESRQAAAEALVAIGRETALPLIGHQGEGSDAFRNISIGIISAIGKPAIPDLIDTVEKGDEHAQTFAADALVAIGDSAVKSLFDAFSTESSPLNDCVVDILWRIGQGNIDVIAAGLKDREETVKIAVAELLGQMDDDQAVQPLVEALFDWQVRDAAARSLDRLGWQFKHKRDRIHYLMAKGEKETLLNAWEETRQVLTDDLDSGEKTATEYAVYAFIELAHWDVFSVLIKKLDEKEDRKLHANACIEPMLSAINHPDPDVRIKVAEILVSIGAPAIEPLADTLSAENPDKSRIATEILVSMGSDAVDSLIPGLKHPSDAVRNGVADVLGKIGDQEAVEPLVRALTDWPVRQTAANALDALEWKPEFEEEEVHYLLAKVQKDAVLQQWPAVHEVLLANLRSGKRRSINYAVPALLETGGENIGPEMISILENEGSIFMAEAYWESQDTQLMQAAEKWADIHDYDIFSSKE
jgi:HEAT repeat protein